MLAATAILACIAGPAMAAALKGGYAACRSDADLARLLDAAREGRHAEFAELLDGRTCFATTGKEKLTKVTRSGATARVTMGKRGTYSTVAEAVR